MVTAVRRILGPGAPGTPRVIAVRHMGADGGRVMPHVKHFDLAYSYTMDPANGSPASAVTALFPSGKYDALAATPTWAGHRFVGWFRSAETPSTAIPSTTGALTADTSVDYELLVVYAHWQLPAAVTFDAATGGGSMPAGWSAPDYYAGQPYGTLPAPTHATLNFTGWYANGAKVSADSIVPTGGATLVAQFSASSYSVDLNNGAWALDSSVNPDSSIYDGVYKSTNVGQDDTMAKMYIDVVGFTSFRVLIASQSEGNYDYVVAMQEDVDPIYMPEDSGWGGTSEGVKASTSVENNYADPSSPGDYKELIYSLDGGSHRICVLYRKDVSYGQDADQGYVLIPKVQGGA